MFSRDVTFIISCIKLMFCPMYRPPIVFEKEDHEVIPI